MIGNLARCQRLARRLGVEGRNGHVFTHINNEMGPAARHLPPRRALGQHRQTTADVYRRNVDMPTHSHIGSTSLQLDAAMQRRTRAFRKNNQVVALLERLQAILEQLRTTVVGGKRAAIPC